MGTVFDIDQFEVRRGRRVTLSLPRLQIRAGEVVTLLGRNGAGKSTLLHCAIGLLKFQARRFDLLGKPVARLRGKALSELRQRIGYMPQTFGQNPEVPLTVREVIATGRTGRAGWFRPLGIEDYRAIDRWIDRLGLDGLADRPFGRLSGGEQRKTLLAAAMVHDPELLLLDEPTANLDLNSREQFVGTLETLLDASPGLTLLLVCHELEVIPPSCRRILLLENGQPIADAAPESVLTAERVASLYGPNFELIERGRRRFVVPGAVGVASGNRGGGDDV